MIPSESSRKTDGPGPRPTGPGPGPRDGSALAPVTYFSDRLVDRRPFFSEEQDKVTCVCDEVVSFFRSFVHWLIASTRTL